MTRRRAKSDLGDAKTRFLLRLVLKERKFQMPEKAVRKSENWRNPHQSSIGRAAGWKIVNSKIVTARQHAKSDPPTCQK